MFGVPDGVGIGCQPLSSIMNEKVVTSYIRCGTISMKGRVRTGDCDEDDEVMNLTDTIDAFSNRLIACTTGQQSRGLILLTFVDEVHMPLAKHCYSVRPYLKEDPGMFV